jgi:hypothetical protein
VDIDPMVLAYAGELLADDGTTAVVIAERFFAGLDIVPAFDGAAPGLSHPGSWGADDPDRADSDGSRWHFRAVARRP